MNAETRSNTLATFLALSQIDPELRAALKRVTMPKAQALSWSQSLDQKLEIVAESLITSLSNQIIGGGVRGFLPARSSTDWQRPSQLPRLRIELRSR